MKTKRKRPTSPTNNARIFITMGDASGIGPEIIMKSLASPEIAGLVSFTIVGDRDVLESAKKYFAPRAKDIDIYDPLPPLKKNTFGKPTLEGAKKALEAIAISACFIKKCAARGIPSALVTAPVSKEQIARVEKGFIGHTEYLQKAFGKKHVTMVMTGKHLSVVPVTRHIPLKNVAKALTPELLRLTLEDVIQNRAAICGKKDAVIGVSALNPHGGEGGKIGTEEKKIIYPVVKNIQKFYPGIIGPLSADIVFYKAIKKEIDIVISMYHDQGLGPFKMIDFDSGVNMTLGLGVMRTSPDHGTAFDIAGKGIADPSSMKRAILLAARAVGRVPRTRRD